MLTGSFDFKGTANRRANENAEFSSPLLLDPGKRQSGRAGSCGIASRPNIPDNRDLVVYIQRLYWAGLEDVPVSSTNGRMYTPQDDFPRPIALPPKALERTTYGELSTLDLHSRERTFVTRPNGQF